MKTSNDKLWQGLAPDARALLRTREYASRDLAERLRDPGVEVSELLTAAGNDPTVKEAWIPGVEIFARTVYPQLHRGVFGELARREEGILKQVGLWPAQWASARMFAGTAKGFHIHPPSVPEGREAAEWFRELFSAQADHFEDRPYEKEQWDVIFFVQGRVEFLLRDARAGLDSRIMRFFIDGDNHRSPNNAGVIVPAGVAHAMRVEGGEDVIMVYGTSTAFHPEFEGRIASEIETASLPESWIPFLRS